MGGFGSFKCGKTSHHSKDYTATTTTTQGSSVICFHCNKMGHKKVDYTSLIVGAVSTPATLTFRITDDRQGKAEAPVVRSRAFQLTDEEARATPNVVTSMCLLLILFIGLLTMLIVYVAI